MVITVGQAIEFRAKVIQGLPDQCWPFAGGKEVTIGGCRLRPQWLAAAIARGRPLEADEVVRAKCRTPRCCNPAHLRVLYRDDARFIELRPVEADLPARPEDVTCSYCAHSGKPGRAVVCNTEVACPACQAPGYPDVLARYGAASALGGAT